MTEDQDINPLEEFFGEYCCDEEQEKDAAVGPKDRTLLRETQKNEIDMWHHWNNNGRKPEHLKPLLDSYKPLLETRARSWKGNVELPTSAIDKEYQRHFVSAVKSYNPERGAKLSTWVDQNLKKAGRYMRTYQNMGKIPEGQIAKITEFKQAQEHLSNKLGFDPDSHTMAEHLGWSQKRVVRMQKELRKDLPASGFQHDPAEFLHPRELEAIKLIQYDLTPEERSVYDHTFGVNGKEMLQPGQIAKVLKINGPKVSRIRNKLRDRLDDAMETLK